MKKIILIAPMLILAFQGTIIGQDLAERVGKGVEQQRPSTISATDPDGTSREMVFRGRNGEPAPVIPKPKVREYVQEQPPQPKPLSVTTSDGTTTREMAVRGRNGMPMQSLPAPERGTPLMLAASDGDLEEIRRLLDEGAEIDATNKNGTTALMFAAANGETEAAVLLINRGANINARNNNGATALCLAVLNGKKNTGYTLMEEGATCDFIIPK